MKNEVDKRSTGGVELTPENAAEVTAKLKRLAEELEASGDYAALDSDLRKLYEELPHCIYRDVVICAGDQNERIMNGEKICLKELIV